MQTRAKLAATVAAASATLLVAAAVLLAPKASAATLFSDDFQDGNSTGWSTNGGSWSVVTDGTPALRQSGTSADARALAGTGWTDQAVQARVKPQAFNGTGRHVGIVARARAPATTTSSASPTPAR